MKYTRPTVANVHVGLETRLGFTHAYPITFILSHPYSVNARRNMLYIICAIPNSRAILYVKARSLLLM